MSAFTHKTLLITGGTGSFGNAVLPFFAQAFREAEFSRAVPYRLDLTAVR